MDYKNIKQFPGIQQKVLLKDFTTYKIGGPAKYFFNAEKTEDLIKLLELAKKTKIKVFILGGGSNLLVADKGFNGLVIKILINQIKVLENKIFVGAGASAAKVSLVASENGLSGLEWATGIPGASIGGCIYGHAQAFGTKISDIIESVEVLDLKNLKLKTFFKNQCKFGLKDSIFKKQKNLVIISSVLVFQKKNVEEVKNKIKEFLQYRSTRHPALASAGSTFVNPEIRIKNKKLLEKYPELIAFNEKGTIPSGYLIQKVGLQGKKIGGAQISEQHANFIVNTGNAKAKDVLALIKLAKQKVKKIFNINLEIEVQIV